MSITITEKPGQRTAPSSGLDVGDLIDSRRGTAVVEAALVTMGFLILVFGIMEVGRFMSVQQTITDATREGARLAVAPASQTTTLPADTQLENRISYYLQANGIPVGGGGATISIDRNVAIGTGLDRYTRATVTYPYRLFSLSWFSNLEVTLRGVSRMRNETSP